MNKFLQRQLIVCRYPEYLPDCKNKIIVTVILSLFVKSGAHLVSCSRSLNNHAVKQVLLL